MSIPFTQILPFGKTRILAIDRPKHIERKAFDLISLGARFECEILRNGDISLTCECDEFEKTVLTNETVFIEDATKNAVDRLVMRAVMNLTSIEQTGEGQ